MRGHGRSLDRSRLARERGQIDFVEDLGIRLGPHPGNWPIRLEAISSFLRTVSPLIIWNAWARVVDSERSHSQVKSRSGLPNVFKNATPPDAPGSWAARSDAGRAEIVRARRRPG